jgi:hypothetical protein
VTWYTSVHSTTDIKHVLIVKILFLILFTHEKNVSDPLLVLRAIKHNHGFFTSMQFQMMEVPDGASWETVDDNEMDLVDDLAQVFSTAYNFL